MCGEITYIEELVTGAVDTPDSQGPTENYGPAPVAYRSIQ